VQGTSGSEQEVSDSLESATQKVGTQMKNGPSLK